MDESSGATQPTPSESGEPQKNFIQRLSGVYFEPSAAFQDINRKSTWLGMFLLVSAFVVGSLYVLTTRMDYETYLRKAMQMSPMTRNLSEEQIQAITSRSQSAVQRYSTMVFAPVGVLATYLAIAAVFLVAFIMMGVSIRFKKSLAVTVWGMGPPALVSSLLGIIVMFIKDPDTLELDASSNLASNLGLLVTAKEKPVLASLLSSIDLFSFWTIALLSIGFAAASNRKLSAGQAAGVVVVVWGIWVLGKAGFAALFS